MMRSELGKYCIQDGASIYEGIQAIDRSDEGVVFIVKKSGYVQGVLTDGDIRRALLSGVTIDRPLLPYVHKDFLRVDDQASRVEVLDVMQARKIRHLPIVDEKGVLIGVHFLSSILGSKKIPNWAVIMAGGKGTRLYPLTKDIPKPMVKVAGRPILERLVLHLVDHGIHRIFLSVNYLSGVIEDHFGNGERFGCQIEYLREDKPLGTAGSLALLPDAPSEPVFVMNGDLVTDIDVSDMLGFQKKSGFDLVMGVKSYFHEVPFGCVEMNGIQVASLQEKPVLEKKVNVGAYVLSPKTIREIELKELPITAIFESALAGGCSVGAYETESDWLDVGYPQQLKAANGIS